ncbi:MAG: 2'-5' RNA ligase family protein [Dehalococcoidia bacterium]
MGTLAGMSDLSSDFTGAWERFQRLDEVRLLEETQEWEWTRGRTDYLAFLITAGDRATRDYISRTIERIEGIPGIDPYPEHYWHITIKGVGFLMESPAEPDEVSAAGADGLAEAARPVIEEVAPFDVRAGPVSAFPEVVILEVHDGGQVRALNTSLLERVPGLMRSPIDGRVFLPHISIARFSSNDGLRQLKEALASLREAEPEGRDGRAEPSFRVTEARLIRAHLAKEIPAFELLAEYALRG